MGWGLYWGRDRVHTGEGVPLHEFCGKPEVASDLPHLVLVEVSQGLHNATLQHGCTVMKLHNHEQLFRIQLFEHLTLP